MRHAIEGWGRNGIVKERDHFIINGASERSLKLMSAGGHILVLVEDVPTQWDAHSVHATARGRRERTKGIAKRETMKL